MPKEVVFHLQYVGCSRELCLHQNRRSTNDVYIGAYYQPSVQYYVSYVVMLLPERQPWYKHFTICFIRCEMKRELSVQERAGKRIKAHQLGGSNNLTRPLQLKFRATKTFAVSVKDHTPRSSEERTSSLPQYLDYRDSALQQRQFTFFMYLQVSL